ncbi:MAG TPA: L-threonylcarbamoyladenylate synthase [Opitutaceae bacterium]|nr:L-threonylcarbamoyladenylate synthase [Opitutaceae bacterium]
MAETSRTGKQARILKPTDRAYRLLARTLRDGGVVGVPTETVYGLAAHALDEGACEKIFLVKGRPTSDPLIVHVRSLQDAEKLAMFSDQARAVAKAFWPGPLTIVLPKRPHVPGIVTAGLDSVAVRVPRHPVFRALLKVCGLPLAAPSANLFGYISPTTAQHVQAGLGDRIPYILDGGSSRIGVESTILDARDPNRLRILRPGVITAEAISRTVREGGGKPVAKSLNRPRSKKAQPGEAQVAPGMLTRHYSPATPLHLVGRITSRQVRSASEQTGWLFYSRPVEIPEGVSRRDVFWLCEKGKPEQAARRLFGLLRRLDAAGYARIVAESAPPSLLADAINDRLKRAAAKAG